MTNEELQKEMIAAMKAKDKVRLSIIRQVKAEVKNIEVIVQQFPLLACLIYQDI